MHPDLALSRVEQVPKDRCRLLVVCDRIGEQVGRHHVMVSEHFLERRDLLDVRDAGGAGRGQAPLILLGINGDHKLHVLPHQNLQGLADALDTLEYESRPAAIISP